ncbi:nitrate/nitrite transporter NrtS [Cyanobacterium stanieri LEGE 03274]|uniref:Nitrate/nitrite transporter NrtS n=1 Tax=Cyanobacterium stanieri LEGE 03274 TaxID=1828756 RepID=A0ABR9V609_9CHRO|nr:nitrate/nitrite transporter NrtS [Cyanobacterium stanieri]MBE9223331.1 nitrate/nitrite transporter NrtS [Cyanobacterium stanieri LEGE 03274]
MNNSLTSYGQYLVTPKYAKKGVKVALFVGTVIFMINHGTALTQGKMTPQRWLSGILSYSVPYFVSIHGQWANSKSKEMG